MWPFLVGPLISAVSTVTPYVVSAVMPQQQEQPAPKEEPKMDWLTSLVSGLGGLAGQAVPYVGEYLTNQQQLELAQYQLQQQQLQAQVAAEQAQASAEKQKTMMYVVGGVAAVGIIAVMLLRR